jgi:hypothetical protein
MRKLFFNIGRLAAAIALLLAVPAFLLPAAGGSLYAYSVLTNTDVDKVWKKSQGGLKQGFNFVTPEFKWVRDFKELEIDASLREMTFPVDLYEDRGITSLPEGGREAEPMSQNAVDATVSFIHLNGRFTVAKRAKWALAADPKAALENQLKFQGKKKIQALGRIAGDMFYGYSTNYICQTSTNATQASGTYTLLNLFGDSTYSGSTTAVKNMICDKIKIGDKVALIRAGALVANAIGSVTAVTPATPSVAITWAGSVDADANDYLVFANGASATTIDHTSYNRGLVGRLDMLKSTSVHSISSSSVPNWAVAHSDTTAGRFSGEKWRKAADEIHNYGDEDAQIVTLMAQGVYRDVLAQYKAGVRFDDTFNLEIDGDIKAKGRRFKSTRRVPPGMVDMFAEGCLVRKSIHESPSAAPAWGAGKELIDDSGWIFGIDESLFIATTNRKAQAYFENQTEI